MFKDLFSILLYHNKYKNGKTKIYYSGQKKSSLLILLDLLRYYFQEHGVFSLYFAMGYDRIGTCIKEFIGKKQIFKKKRHAEKVIKCYYEINLDYDVITKDKFYAGAILRANGLRCIDDLGIIVNDEIIQKNGRVLQLQNISSLGNDLILKNIVLEASEGILFLHFENKDLYLNHKLNTIDNLECLVHKKVYVVQKRHMAHPAIRKINSTALNTIRIVTVLDGRTPVLLGGYLAIATGKTDTDTWSEGSLSIGIDFDKGCLKKSGFRSPWHVGEGIVFMHPDSSFVFENYLIPYLAEAVDLCLNAHRIFYTNFLLGWDIAITTDGPMIVEVNEKPGMNVLQITTGGLKDKFNNYYEHCIKSYQEST